MTLTKDQRRHRRRQQDGSADCRRSVSKSGKPSARITKRNLNVRVSVAAYERLSALAEDEGRSREDQLTHMIIQGLPKYSTNVSGDLITQPHRWDEADMNQEGMTFKTRAKKESKRLCYWVSSTAWNKLHAHKTNTKESKARIVERLILTFNVTSPEYRQKMRDRLEEMKETYATLTPFRPEQVSEEEAREAEKRMNEFWERREKEQEKYLDSLCSDVLDRHG